MYVTESTCIFSTMPAWECCFAIMLYATIQKIVRNVWLYLVYNTHSNISYLIYPSMNKMRAKQSYKHQKYLYDVTWVSHALPPPTVHKLSRRFAGTPSPLRAWHDFIDELMLGYSAFSQLIKIDLHWRSKSHHRLCHLSNDTQWLL